MEANAPLTIGCGRRGVSSTPTTQRASGEANHVSRLRLEAKVDSFLSKGGEMLRWMGRIELLGVWAKPSGAEKEVDLQDGFN